MYVKWIDIFLGILVDLYVLEGKCENIIQHPTLFPNAPKCWGGKWKNLRAGSGNCSRVRDLTCLWRVAATVACLTGTSTWIILIQSAASLVPFISRIVEAQMNFFISLNMCSNGWLLRSANENLRQTFLACLTRLLLFDACFCRHCVISTKNTQYTFQLINGCFLKFLAQFSLYTLTFRGAARPGKPKNANEQERQIIHIVDWCENITSLVIEDRATSDCMFF